MPMIGQAIPEGTYQTYHQNEIRSVTLRSYQGRWLVLVFYPGDFTFICPTELEDLGMLYPEFQKLNAEVLGISTDSVYVHKTWRDTSPAVKDLPVPLLADPGGRLAQRLGVFLSQDGVACEAASSSTRPANCVRMKYTTIPLDVTWKSCSARYKRRPSFMIMGKSKSVRLAGSLVKER